MDTPIPVKKVIVMHVAWALDSGGVEELLYLTAKYSNRDKFDLKFIVCSEQIGTIGEKIQQIGYLVQTINVSSRIFDLRTIYRLIRVFRLHRPDIVHLYSKVNLLGRFATKLAGVKISICNEVDLDGAGPNIGIRFVAFLKRRLEFLSDCILSCSKTVQKHWSCGDGKRHRVIYLPVDIENFSSLEVRSSNGDFKNGEFPVVGMIARVCPGKGHEFLVRAIPELRDAFPDVQVRIVGKGPLMTSLRQLADAMGVSRNIHFVGYALDTLAELQTFDLFVLPSLSEGFPISILEAMAAGLPIAASNVGGIPEAIENGVTGLLFDPQSSEALATAVTRLLRNPERARVMGTAGKQKVVQEFSPDRYLACLEDLYRDLWREKRASEAEMG